MRVIREVFSSPFFAVLALVTALLFFTLSNWLPNYPLIFGSLFSAHLSGGEKLLLLTNMFFEFRIATLLVAILFGINIALLAYLFSRKRMALGASGTGFFGVLAGFLGIGCASCGSVIGSLLGLSGAVALLPLHGEEFLFFGIVLLSYSIFSTLREIAHGEVCPV